MRGVLESSSWHGKSDVGFPRSYWIVSISIGHLLQPTSAERVFGLQKWLFPGLFGGWAKQEASSLDLSLKLLFFCAQESLTDAERMK